MDCSRFFEAIDGLCSRYVDVWEDVCNIESPSLFKEGVDAVGAYFSELAVSRSWDVERFPQERFGDVIRITANAESSKPPVVLSGHMDTVHPIGLFGTPAVRREGDFLFGPGVADCKGGIVAGLLAMHALDAGGYSDRPLMMLLQSNEEVGSGIDNKAPIRCICEQAKGAVAFLNLEAHNEGKICTEFKGLVGFTFCVRGVAAHSANCAKEGASAIAEAAYKIIELERIKEIGGVTFNCGKIRGGSAANTVPDTCEFQLDVRYSTLKELERAKEIVERVASTVYVSGCSCDVKMTNLRMPMERCERNLELVRLANSAFAENGLPVLAEQKLNGASDASDITVCGIPCLETLGVVGSHIHSAQECSPIASLAAAAKRLCAIIVNL